MRDAVAIALAAIAGVLLAVYDGRTDDTGIEVGLLLVASLGMALLAPRRWWAVALCVGLPIPIAELLIRPAAVPAGVVALGIAFVGSLIGFGIARAAATARA